MVRLLHVEDNDDDALLVTLALDQAAPGWRRRASYLRATTVAEGRAGLKSHRPHVVLLDLSLGEDSGHDLLTAMKGAPETSRTPVIVLSNSDDPIDVAACYDALCAAYLVKPTDFTQLVETMKAMAAFWLDAVSFSP